MKRLLLTVLAAVAVTTGSAHAATYYVSPDGSDSNPGTSAAPWKSVSRVNNAALAPGDTVLFAAGATFSDSTLMPSRSGTATAPITFGSYGSGRATISNASGAVWLAPARDNLVFDGLQLTTGGTSVGIFSDSGSAPGSSNITISNSVITNTAGVGIGSWQPTDTGWRILNNTISHTGDSAIISFGNGTVVDGNRITDVGWNTSITWAKHAVYAKGPNQVIANNDISGVPRGQAASIRFRGARVYGNAIHDTPYAVGFFDYDAGPLPKAASHVYGNRIWNVGGWLFYYGGQNDPLGRPASVGIVFANNSISLSGASEAVNVSESRDAHVIFANNVVTGSYSSAFRGLAGKTSEYHNAWSGGAFNVPTTTSNVYTNPKVTAPSFVPATDSPVVDRASLSVPDLTFSGACNGLLLSYCGVAPDMGAVELAPITAPPLPPPPAPADTQAPTVPTGLARTAVTQSSISVSWSPSTDNVAVTGYGLYRDGASDGATPNVTATFSGLTCGRSYTFGVDAVDAAGNRSARATVTLATLACDAVLLPVDNLIANGSFESSLVGWVSWQGSLSRVTGGVDGTYAVRATVSAGRTAYSVDDSPDAVTSAVAGNVYEATASVRGISGRQLCLTIREWNLGGVVGTSDKCVTASTSWQKIGPVSYTVKQNGSTVDVLIAQGNAVDGDNFDADGILFKRVASTATATVIATAPVNVTRPAVTGTTRVGYTLTSSTGTWTGSPTITYRYQWQRCSSTGTNCASISGATAKSYKLVSADRYRTVRAVVTATNGVGSAQATSATTAAIR